jgi:hypothetical protein
MSDALLVSDQQIDARFLPEARTARVGFSPQNLSQDILGLPGPSSFSGNNSFYGEQTLQGYGPTHHNRDRSADSFVSHLRNHEATLDAHLRRGKLALKKASQVREKQKQKLFQEELHWLAENRYRFPGQWIALEGDQLLAVGPTAQEVFSKVADQRTPPLVVKITDDELPFAGW